MTQPARRPEYDEQKPGAADPRRVLQTSARRQVVTAKCRPKMRADVMRLAFLMTGDEAIAEAVTDWTLVRFPSDPRPSDDQLMRAFIGELSYCDIKLGTLTLRPIAVLERGKRLNTKLPELEAAVISLPATERFIYLMHDGHGHDFRAIAEWLELHEEQVQVAGFYARLHLREILARERPGC